MNIKGKESSLEQYAIISYSHKNTDVVEAELDIYEKHGICYWYDREMDRGGSYKTQFRNKLDSDNCKGIIYFISETFISSPNCADEIKYFLDKYKINNPDKFCLFVLPKGFPVSGKNDIAVNKKNISVKVKEYFKNESDPKARAEFEEDVDELGKHIDWFLELSENTTSLYGVLGNDEGYVEECCKDGKIFSKIMFGHKRVDDETFGYFPQTNEEERKKVDASDIEKKHVERDADKATAYYAPVEWIVIGDNEQSQTLLSKNLLFAIDYMNLKYPFLQTNKTIEEEISGKFLEYFIDENDKRKIKAIRFLSENELQVLHQRYQKDLKKILLPKATFFAQISNRKNAPAFWLAGDINDARRVDAAAGGLSDQKTGVELYYVRIVIEVDK